MTISISKRTKFRSWKRAMVYERREGGRDFSSIWSRRTRAAPFIRCIMLRAIVLNPRHSYGTPCSLEHRATSRELPGLSFIPPNSNK